MGKQADDPSLDPDTPRVHEPSTMRAIAEALRQNLHALEQPGAGGTTLVDAQPGAAQFGEWTDAKAFGTTAGKDSAGQKLGQVHAAFVRAYKEVIAAIEASAGNHAEADTRNEGA
ncbi:hypothetical protein ACIBEJ_04970 [Nonomuraea sp. NPDC050790]|uniref:hypothetical protein n=1 Tax=Nonomuraea sp. NPDC050790 TaxID=3364371 RepID=UPI00379DBCA1